MLHVTLGIHTHCCVVVYVQCTLSNDKVSSISLFVYCERTHVSEALQCVCCIVWPACSLLLLPLLLLLLLRVTVQVAM
jgi:hypothetical protein